MANNFIAVNLGTRLGASLMQGAQNLNWSLDVLTSLKTAMDNMITGGIDFTTVETQFGLPVGKGQTVYNLLAGAIAAMDASTDVTQLLAWLATCRT